MRDYNTYEEYEAELARQHRRRRHMEIEEELADMKGGEKRDESMADR